MVGTRGPISPASGIPIPPNTSAVFIRLADAARHPSHEFWPADISLLDSTVIAHLPVHGPRQVTDFYSLALAVKHDGCFATFDRSIPLRAVRSARAEHLIVI